MKKYILNETQLKRLLDNVLSENKVISEQTEVMNGNKAIQCFLNKRGIKDDKNQPLKVDGLIGTYPKSSSAQAIMKYQTLIKVYPTDGVWGENTTSKMPKNDLIIYNKCKSEHGDLIDKGFNKVGEFIDKGFNKVGNIIDKGFSK